jgi:hypothetical protein
LPQVVLRKIDFVPPAGYPVSGFTGYPALLDIRLTNLVSGRIPDIKKMPDYPAGYPVHP